LLKIFIVSIKENHHILYIARKMDIELLAVEAASLLEK